MFDAWVELLLVWWTGSLARGGAPLELHRAEIADGRVPSLRVVKPLDVVEHIGPSLVAISSRLSIADASARPIASSDRMVSVSARPESTA